MDRRHSWPAGAVPCRNGRHTVAHTGCDDCGDDGYVDAYEVVDPIRTSAVVECPRCAPDPINEEQTCTPGLIDGEVCELCNGSSTVWCDLAVMYRLYLRVQEWRDAAALTACDAMRPREVEPYDRVLALIRSMQDGMP